ncbi:hypothetical protein SNEBB_007002 [Seison nebaliae]|nr:hypothetical protein SNEBB_007002 [Seison nebaliae]
MSKLLGSVRLYFALVASLGYLAVYSTRINLSVGIVCMLNHTAVSKDKGNASTKYAAAAEEMQYCSGNNDTQEPTEMKDGEFVWSSSVQGLLLSSFFWGYTLSQVAGGILSDRLGGKRVWGYSMLVAGLLTIISPWAAKLHWSALFMTRIIIGICQGAVFPATSSLMARWAPPLELGILTSISNAGSQIGNVVTLTTGGAFCDWGFYGGWPHIFFFTGLITCIWFVMWMWFVSDTPQTNRFMKQEELNYMNSHIPPVSRMVFSQVPWKLIFTSKPIWAANFSAFTSLFGVFLMLTSVPSFMKDVLKYDIKKNGLLSSIPYILFWAICILTGLVSDIIQKKKLMTTTSVRKFFTVLGNIVPAVSLIVLAYLDCRQRPLAVLFLSLGVSFAGCIYGGGFVPNFNDIAPEYAGLLMGIGNSLGSFAGIFSPLLCKMITTDGTQYQWRIVFYMTAAVYVSGCIVYVIFGSGAVQPWARRRSITSQNTSPVGEFGALGRSVKPEEPSMAEGTTQLYDR